MGHRYTADSNVIMGTLRLWKVHGRMPVKMHEKRRFVFERNGTRFVCILDISKTGSVLEEYQYKGEDVCGYSKFRVNDMYYEGGDLVVDTKNSFFGVNA